jgi:NitT/TauT family transport system ATP-binding protein
MRQRAALIRTLAVDPELLLLDEPFSALDYQTRLALGDEISAIIRNEKKTALFVTHDIAEAISIADRVILLTKRPASVKRILSIDMPGVSPLKRRSQPSFQDYFNTIWKEMDVHV